MGLKCRAFQQVVICFLRVKASVLNLKKHYYDESTPNKLDCYSWLPSTKIGPYWFPGFFTPTHREGREVGWVDNTHPFYQFFQGFKNEIGFEAVIDDQYLIASSKPIAKNKAQELIALELPFGSGKFIFLPPFHTRVDVEKLAGIMKNCIRESLGWTAPDQKPPWIDRYELPGLSEIRLGIIKLEEQIQVIEDKKRGKEGDLNQLEMLKGLLYEQGKYGLEPCVREAFRILGFNVLDPEKYEEDYDLYTKEGELAVIGEIEGTAKQVNVDKYRQLLDYVDAKRLKGEKCKGILIGNGLIKKEPDKRDEQFTPHVIRGCNQQKFCRMTTYELFKAVRAVLSDSSDHKLKEKIKRKIIDCENEFRFGATT